MATGAIARRSGLRGVLQGVWQSLTAAIRSPRAGAWGGPVVREPYPGAWQKNEEISGPSTLAYFAVFACATLIAADIAKLGLRLVQLDEDGVWTPTSSPAFSPVLRKPNRYQNPITFLAQWIMSKLTAGNAYILKQRDERGVVVALYVLEPDGVTPLVAPDGSVYYQLKPNELAGLAPDAPFFQEGGVAPAREIIHDRMVTLFHPLIGVSPIFACGLPALQGLKIQQASTTFFANGSTPGGILTSPGEISQEQADAVKTYWETNFSGNNAGKVAVIGDGLKYEQTNPVSAVDAQLIEQLKWSSETVCACFHVPPYMIGVGGYPPYNNGEPLLQLYYSQCLQHLIVSLETCLDEGLELPAPYGTELDIDDLIWMDTNSKTTASREAIGSGSLSPNEARFKYFGKGKVAGGDSPYLQQQYYSLASLAARDALGPPPGTPDPLVAFADALERATAPTLATMEG